MFNQRKSKYLKAICLFMAITIFHMSCSPEMNTIGKAKSLNDELVKISDQDLSRNNRFKKLRRITNQYFW